MPMRVEIENAKDFCILALAVPFAIAVGIGGTTALALFLLRAAPTPPGVSGGIGVKATKQIDVELRLSVTPSAPQESTPLPLRLDTTAESVTLPVKITGKGPGEISIPLIIDEQRRSSGPDVVLPKEPVKPPTARKKQVPKEDPNLLPPPRDAFKRAK